MSLKPIEDLMTEFCRTFGEALIAAKARTAQETMAVIIEQVHQLLQSRDDEHAALLVTTDAYAKGFAAGAARTAGLQMEAYGKFAQKP